MGRAMRNKEARVLPWPVLISSAEIEEMVNAMARYAEEPSPGLAPLALRLSNNRADEPVDSLTKLLDGLKGGFDSLMLSLVTTDGEHKEPFAVFLSSAFVMLYDRLPEGEPRADRLRRRILQVLEGAEPRWHRLFSSAGLPVASLAAFLIFIGDGLQPMLGTVLIAGYALAYIYRPSMRFVRDPAVPTWWARNRDNFMFNTFFFVLSALLAIWLR